MLKGYLVENEASKARIVFRFIAYILIILTVAYFLLALTSSLGEVFSFAKTGFFKKFKSISNASVYYSFIFVFLVALCFLVLGSTRSVVLKITGVSAAVAISAVVILSFYFDFKMPTTKGVESQFENSEFSGFFIQSIYTKPLKHNALKQILVAFKLQNFAHFKLLVFMPGVLTLLARFHAAGSKKKYLAFLRLGLDILTLSFVFIGLNLFLIQNVSLDLVQHALVYSSLSLSALGFTFLLTGTIIAFFHIKKY